jgi:uncharacterized protein YfaS (alpha-2-macroglobulin family)
MAAGLDFLLAYPYGCTEQRLSRARAQLALAKFRDLLHLGAGDGGNGGDAALDRAVTDTLAWIPQVVTEGGLCAYWPGAQGSVALTAWVVEFLIEAKAAGHPVDEALLADLLRTLEQALRSDYRRFLDGEAWSERTYALKALAAAGKFDPAYGAELARRSAALNLESVAGVAMAFDRAGQRSSPAVAPLEKELWAGVVTRLHQGREIFGGVRDRGGERNGLILPSETRTLAEMTRSLARLEADDRRLQLLIDALVQLGKGDGWGSTQANAAALLALSEIMQPPFSGAARGRLEMRLPEGTKRADLGPDAPTAFAVSTRTGPAEIVLAATAEAAGAAGPAGGIALRAEVSYVPQAPGSEAPARREGFVVSRELLHQGSEPPVKLPLAEPGSEVALAVGDVIEEHVQVVNPDDRHYVAVVVPLAAGMEPLTPHLATAPPEARPTGQATLAPSYAAFLDDHVAFYYDSLPKGTYDFYFRTRATVPGRFIQPGARAEMMYDGSVVGTSAGAWVEVVRSEEAE